MNVHVVDSNQHMLNPNDIFIVAAHEYKDGLEQFKAASKKYGVSPERLQYTTMVRMYQDPSLLRIRAGNTMFAIKALPHRAGMVFSFNGDTAKNFVNNMVEFFHSARKMGFDVLIAQLHAPDMVKLAKLAAKRVQSEGVTSKYDSKSKLFVVKTGKPRGE